MNDTDIVIDFDNTCGCIFDRYELDKAVKLECKNRSIVPNTNYKIFLYNQYPAIALKHEKVRLHVLMAKYIFEFSKKNLHIHHIDENKLNILPNNLLLVTNSGHQKLHKENHVITNEMRLLGREKAKKAISRLDVSTEKVTALHNSGLSCREIAEELNCGLNTVKRRMPVISS